MANQREGRQQNANEYYLKKNVFLEVYKNINQVNYPNDNDIHDESHLGSNSKLEKDYYKRAKSTFKPS